MSIRQKIKNVFPGLVAFSNRVYNHIAHLRFKNMSSEEVFNTIYKENHWGDEQSLSGTGSNEKNTIDVIKIVDDSIKKFSIESILDIPCGDFNWMQKVDLKSVNYAGADIVSELIERNKKFEKDKVKFQQLSLLSSSLPKVDLIFTRDCLVHFSYKDISRAIEIVKRSGSKYWMTSTFPMHDNYDIITGDWRPVNLQAAPFNFPEPLVLWNEQCREDHRYADKSLAVWAIDSLK
jgi:hypothetical protein